MADDPKAELIAKLSDDDFFMIAQAWSKKWHTQTQWAMGAEEYLAAAMEALEEFKRNPTGGISIGELKAKVGRASNTGNELS